MGADSTDAAPPEKQAGGLGKGTADPAAGPAAPAHDSPATSTEHIQAEFREEPPAAYRAAAPAAPPKLSSGVAAQSPATAGEWKTSLCGCCGDLPLCCLSCWFPCISSGRTLAWVEGFPEDSGLYIVGTFFMGVLGCFCCIEFYNRGKLREKFSIDGSGCQDCLVAWFCLCCARQQHAHQVGCQTCSGPTEPVC